ncbi:MAG: hypothetical protein JNK78_02945 [Planctomycetes bacterium]|nr:hypothetical protein [Planctomycetota bacterium]
MAEPGTTRPSRTAGTDAVARIAAALPAATPGSHVVMVFEGERNRFLATLVAAWQRGHGAALPEDPRRLAVTAALTRPDVALLAHDTGVGTGLDVRTLAAEDVPGFVVDPKWIGAVTCVAAGADSGAIARSWSAADVAGLLTHCAATLALPRDATVWNAFPTATPCALLPGLLAPLVGGAHVVGRSGVEVETMAHELAASFAHTLVAPAATLRALSLLGADTPALVQVVAADEALDEGSVRRFAANGVRTIRLSTLETPRPHDDAAAQLAADLLLGDGVADAAVEAVVTPAGRVLCCIVATQGSLDDARRRAHADGAIEMRRVAALPREPDGRVPRDAVLRLCGRNADGSPVVHDLAFVPAAPNGERRVFRVQVPTGFFAFAGHFATYPVLSGAMQLHELVLPCLRLVAGPGARPTAFQDLKFLARIAPGDTVDVSLRVDAAAATAEFEIVRGDTKCSSGRASLRSTESPP